MQTICTSLQTDNRTTPHHSIFTNEMLFSTPSQLRQSTEADTCSKWMTLIQCRCCVDMSAWSSLYVPAAVLCCLRDLQFTSPTPVQALCLPPAIRDRRDVVAAAETVSICLSVCHTQMGMVGIPREIRRNGDRCCGNTAGMEMGAVEIPRGWSLFLLEPGRDTLGILALCLMFHPRADL